MDIMQIRNIQSDYIRDAAPVGAVNADGSFDSIFAAALNMLKETSDLENDAHSKEIQFALGDADNAHDLQIAQKKANEALAYTVAVRDKVLEAYNSIMNMQM